MSNSRVLLCNNWTIRIPDVGQFWQGRMVIAGVQLQAVVIAQ